MFPFSFGLFLVSATTLMYEVVITRLMSVMTVYYLAFVSVSMGMLGMTAGALFVQLRPNLFTREQAPKRLWQAAIAMATSLPLALLTMQSVPIDFQFNLQMLYSFLLFSALMALPFFCSGVAICLALTSNLFPVGKVYAMDLLGAAAGSLGAIGLLELMDPSSAILAISALSFLGAAAWVRYAGETPRFRQLLGYALGMASIAALNVATPSAFRPLWCKGKLEERAYLAAEVWNPISRIRAFNPTDSWSNQKPFSWAASENVPPTKVNSIVIDIDNGAATPLIRYNGTTGELSFLANDVSAMAPSLRAGGSAAIIGVGGGRDVLTAHYFNFKRIVGIELNPGIVDLVTRRFVDYGRINTIPGFDIYNDEGRSYLSRTTEKFDVIQASMVDTWAATAAGAMSLSENSLYTVEGWRIFYDHLKPDGLITFTRWNHLDTTIQTKRMFALGWATLLDAGIQNPGTNIALIGSRAVATILVSNAPLSPADINGIRATSERLGFQLLYMPGEPPHDPDLKAITSARTISDLRGLHSGVDDFSPVFDSSPFFFNTLRPGVSDLHSLATTIRNRTWGSGNGHALAFVLTFMLTTIVMLALTIEIPLARSAKSRVRSGYVLAGGIVYFVGIGLGFMLAEMAMMQQLSIFLGQPIHSMIVTLCGLILATGIGSLVSERLSLGSAVTVRTPAIVSAAALICYSIVVLPIIHQLAYLTLWGRALTSLAMVMPCGFLFGFCFPVGLRWMRALGEEERLPWMWALNGAASVVASFIAVLIAIEVSITASVLTAAACYIIAGVAMPWVSTSIARPERVQKIPELLSDGG